MAPHPWMCPGRIWCLQRHTVSLQGAFPDVPLHSLYKHLPWLNVFCHRLCSSLFSSHVRWPELYAINLKLLILVCFRFGVKIEFQSFGSRFPLKYLSSINSTSYGLTLEQELVHGVGVGCVQESILFFGWKFYLLYIKPSCCCCAAKPCQIWGAFKGRIILQVERCPWVELEALPKTKIDRKSVV